MRKVAFPFRRRTEIPVFSKLDLQLVMVEATLDQFYALREPVIDMRHWPPGTRRSDGRKKSQAQVRAGRDPARGRP